MELFEVFFLSLGIIGAFMVFMFLIATAIKNNGIVDIGWGLGFTLVAVLLLYKGPEYSPRKILITVMTALWGIRLAIHIFIRNWGKPEDFRYANWRKEWGKWVVIRAFFQVFILQGAIMFVISLPIQFVHADANAMDLNWLDYLGAGIWLIGWLFESIGDLQLMLFIRKPKPKPRFLTTGLWAYTRHPNYFGEVFLWWGVFIVALNAPSGWMTIISPIAITYLLLKVSGIPMLEAPYKGNKEFDAYKTRTNAFFPWFPKNPNK